MYRIVRCDGAKLEETRERRKNRRGRREERERAIERWSLARNFVRELTGGPCNSRNQVPSFDVYELRRQNCRDVKWRGRKDLRDVDS